MYGGLFDSVRVLTLLILGTIFSKGFMAEEPKELSLPIRILYYVILGIFYIIAIVVAALVVDGVVCLVEWLLDLVWPMIWPI